jgi:hypothetical protein
MRLVPLPSSLSFILGLAAAWGQAGGLCHLHDGRRPHVCGSSALVHFNLISPCFKLSNRHSFSLILSFSHSLILILSFSHSHTLSRLSYLNCCEMRRLLHNLRVHFEERDVAMDAQFLEEVAARAPGRSVQASREQMRERKKKESKWGATIESFIAS